MIFSGRPLGWLVARVAASTGGRSSFMGSPPPPIVEGDDVVVAGKQRGGVLMGTGYRNFTRSRAEAITGVGPVIVGAMLLAGVAGFLYGGWSSQGASGPDLADWLRWPFGLVFGLAIVYEVAEPFYGWTLRRKAYRRMRLQRDIKGRTEPSS
jgi:hypothetical protein